MLNNADTEMDIMKAAKMKLDANALNLSLETEIFRVFPYAYFKEILEKGNNILVRPSMWEDPFENILFNHSYCDRNGENIDISCIRDSWYGQSWTDRKDECDGLWRVYSNNGQNRCVRVKTTVQKIFSPLYVNSMSEWQCFIGKVEYVPEEYILNLLERSQALSTDRTNINQTQLLLTKRLAFKYENEVRILYCKGVQENNHDTIYKYVINPNEVFDEVLLDPWLPDRMVRNIQDDIYCAGFRGIVRKSQIYAKVGFTTTLV